MSIIKNVLSDKYFNQACNLFEHKKWDIKYEEGEISEFQRFCDRLSILENEEQRDLFIELSYDYLWVPMCEYEQLLGKTWNKFFESHKINYKNKERLVICPLLPEEDFGKNKSSMLMLYLCQGVMLRRHYTFSDEQVRICEKPGLLDSLECEISELVLIDDFIGSGETAIRCLEFIKKLKKQINNITILALVTQTEGKECISRTGVDVISAIERGKGITDKYNQEVCDYKKQIMKDIEKFLNVSYEYKFGYGQSEALVSMIKTPNNTFPIYWYETENKKAPFPRKNNIKIIN